MRWWALTSTSARFSYWDGFPLRISCWFRPEIDGHNVKSDFVTLPSVTTTSDRHNTTVQQQQLYSVHTYRYVATISTSQVPWKCRHSSLWHSNCDHSLHITKWRRVDLGVAKKEEKRIKFLWIDEPYRSTFNDVKVPPRFELGLPDSESGVLTITPWDHIPSIVFND